MNGKKVEAANGFPEWRKEPHFHSSQHLERTVVTSIKTDNRVGRVALGNASSIVTAETHALFFMASL